uniref:Uncharacterized protein n=1 Tax=Rhizophora mucronata TaxID=61149 RepID=A0A2P2NKN3_RHIMU
MAAQCLHAGISQLRGYNKRTLSSMNSSTKLISRDFKKESLVGIAGNGMSAVKENFITYGRVLKASIGRLTMMIVLMQGLYTRI